MASRGRTTGQKPRGRAAGSAAGSQQPPVVSKAELAARRERLLTVIEPVVIESGYDLDALNVKQVGRRHLVQVTIDGDAGIGLDAIALVSRAVSSALDEAEEAGPALIAGEYQLEVSSPGVDRPLTLPRHWRRNAGRLVKVTVGGISLTGRIVEATDEAVTIESEGGTAQAYGYTDLGPGRIQIEFNRLEEISDDDLEVFPDSDDELDDSDDLEGEEQR